LRPVRLGFFVVVPSRRGTVTILGALLGQKAVLLILPTGHKPFSIAGGIRAGEATLMPLEHCAGYPTGKIPRAYDAEFVKDQPAVLLRTRCRRQFFAQLPKKAPRLVTLGKNTDKETRKHIVRGRLLQNAIQGKDGGAMSAKILGSESETQHVAAGIPAGPCHHQRPAIGHRPQGGDTERARGAMIKGTEDQLHWKNGCDGTAR
jgi:hypothetical protein